MYEKGGVSIKSWRIKNTSVENHSGVRLNSKYDTAKKSLILAVK